jgi:hypothetical protein
MSSLTIKCGVANLGSALEWYSAELNADVTGVIRGLVVELAAVDVMLGVELVIHRLPGSPTFYDAALLVWDDSDYVSTTRDRLVSQFGWPTGRIVARFAPGSSRVVSIQTSHILKNDYPATNC